MQCTVRRRKSAHKATFFSLVHTSHSVWIPSFPLQSMLMSMDVWNKANQAKHSLLNTLLRADKHTLPLLSVDLKCKGVGYYFKSNSGRKRKSVIHFSCYRRKLFPSHACHAHRCRMCSSLDWFHIERYVYEQV